MEPTPRPYTIIDYLHGKVADYTFSENALESILAERGIEPSTLFTDVDDKMRHLCYADSLKYIYLQPNMTKSYSQTNGTWSQKEGATQLSAEDKKIILREMRRQYALGEEELPIEIGSSIKITPFGMRVWPKRRY